MRDHRSRHPVTLRRLELWRQRNSGAGREPGDFTSLSVYERSCRRREALQELFVGLGQRLAWTAQGLDTDMIRAGIPMGPKTRADRLVIAPGHDGIDQAVGTAIGKIRLGKAEALPIL